MRSCEVCQGFRPELASRTPEPKLQRVELGPRSVALCATHFYIWRWSRVTTFDGLRKLFQESEGRRSFVARRGGEDAAEVERRVRPVGRRAAECG